MLQRVRYQDVGSLPKKAPPQPAFHPTEWKEVLAQAESLFARGDYEQALVWYHRGQKMRPKARDFHNGIVKCENAIANNTETVDDFDDDLMMDMRSIRTYGKMTEKSKHTSKTTGTRTSSKRHLDTHTVRDVEHVMSLDKDRVFLKDLLTQIDNEHVGNSKSAKQLRRKKSGRSTAKTSRSSMATVVAKSLKYMDTRSVYWKQQMPLSIMTTVQAPRRGAAGSRVGRESVEEGDEGFSRKYAKLLSDIMQCNEEFMVGNFGKCIDRAKLCIKCLKKYKSSEVNNKYEILGSLYSVLGNAHFELEQYKEALDSYQKDLDIANEKDILPSKSRALENMGRVYARVGEFDTAIHVWKEKLAMATNANEEAWLQHELGYCFLSKRDFAQARQHGEAAMALSRQSGDMRWHLNACLLVAQAQAKLREYELAHKYFTRAHDLACEFLDEHLAQTIEDAIDDTERAIKYYNKQQHKEHSEPTTNPAETQQNDPPKRPESRLSVDHSVLASNQDRDNASKHGSNQDLTSQVENVDTKPKKPEPKKEKAMKIETGGLKGKHQEHVMPQRQGKYKDMTIEKMRKEMKEAMENKKRQAEEQRNNPENDTQAKTNPQKKPEEKPKVECKPQPKVETKPPPKTEPKSEPKPSTPKPVSKPETLHESKPPKQVVVPEPVPIHNSEPEEDFDSEEVSTQVSSTQKPKKNKLPWKSRYKDVPSRHLRIYFKTGNTKQIKMAATQGAPDDEDSDEEYKDVMSKQRPTQEQRKRKSSPKKQKDKDNADFCASDVARTPYGPVITEFKNQRGMSFVKPPVSSINAVPVNRDGTFMKPMQREHSFSVDDIREASPTRGLQREGSFSRPMQREGSFMKREDSFVRSIQREGSFTKPVRSRPPPSPRRKGKTFYENTESGTTYRSFDDHGPNQNTVTDNTPYARNPREDSYMFSPSRLHQQKQAGLSQSLPSIAYRKPQQRRTSHSTIGEETNSARQHTRTKLPLLPKSGKTNVTTAKSERTNHSDRSERQKKPHPRNEGGKAERKPKERGDEKKMNILKMLLDEKK